MVCSTAGASASATSVSTRGSRAPSGSTTCRARQGVGELAGARPCRHSARISSLHTDSRPSAVARPCGSAPCRVRTRPLLQYRSTHPPGWSAHPPPAPSQTAPAAQRRPCARCPSPAARGQRGGADGQRMGCGLSAGGAKHSEMSSATVVACLPLCPNRSPSPSRPHLAHHAGQRLRPAKGEGAGPAAKQRVPRLQVDHHRLVAAPRLCGARARGRDV